MRRDGGEMEAAVVWTLSAVTYILALQVHTRQQAITRHEDTCAHAEVGVWLGFALRLDLVLWNIERDLNPL